MLNIGNMQWCRLWAVKWLYANSVQEIVLTNHATFPFYIPNYKGTQIITKTKPQQNGGNINDSAYVISVSLSNQIIFCSTAVCWLIGNLLSLLFNFEWCSKIFIQRWLFHDSNDNIVPYDLGFLKTPNWLHYKVYGNLILYNAISTQ